MPFNFPATIANLLNGPGMFAYAPSTQARPAKIDDILSMTSPYALKSGWLPGGATDDATEYERDFDTEDYEIQQRTGAILSRPTSFERTFTVPFAEITPELTRIAEQSPPIETIAQGAAASGTPAQSVVHLGLPRTLTRYRCAVIGERDPGFGATGEGGARGRLVAVVGYLMTIQADGSGFELETGELASREVTFTAYPEEAITDPEKQHGAVFFETGLTVP